MAFDVLIFTDPALFEVKQDCLSLCVCPSVCLQLNLLSLSLSLCLSLTLCLPLSLSLSLSLSEEEIKSILPLLAFEIFQNFWDGWFWNSVVTAVLHRVEVMSVLKNEKNYNSQKLKEGNNK